VKDTKAMKRFSPADFLSIPIRPHGSRRNFVSRALVIFFLLHSTYLPAQQTKAPESAVKATYLYNFSRFVQWPADAAAAKGDAFSICVLGEDPFGAVLDSILSGETIGGKPVMTKRVARSQDALDCRVLYISASEDGRLKEILAGLDKSGVLTVSDIPQFSQRGGMIQFVLVGNKLRFEVNLTNAQTAGLTLSSDLLKVAVAVRKSS
jgi:hypothetical protein